MINANTTNARSRRAGRATVAATVLTMLAAVITTVGSSPATAGTDAGAKYERAVIAKINKARAARGIAPLRVVPCPDRLAEARARLMRRTHQLTRVTSPTMAQECSRPLRLNRSAITYKAPRALVRGWLSRRASRSTLLDRRVRWIGIGALTDPSSRWHVSLLAVGRRTRTSQPASTEEATPAGEALSTSTVTETELAELQAAIFRATNRRRANRGLPPLEESSCATGFAERHTAWMVETGTLAHASLSALSDRCGGSGAAENVATFAGRDLDASTVLKAWMDSPSHRANILDPDLDRLGVAVAYDSAGGRWYATQDFLRVG